MMGRVRLNSKRAAFSISSAMEGSGAREREVVVVAAMRAADLRERSLGSRGRELWGRWNLGLGVVVGGREGEEVIRVLVEATIMLAMAVASFSAISGMYEC